MQPLSQPSAKSMRNASAALAFAGSLAMYWATADPGASYWDCPEYITCASLLEVGHPPGNPIWMLAMRAATIPFAQTWHPLVVNLCSGLFMALAVMLTALIIFDLVVWTATPYAQRHAINTHDINITAALASLGGAACFAFGDSTWFSAVEAEVYAFSTFLTALSVWLMMKWARTPAPAQRSRLILLLAYIMGLSLGVHQLNLLCIPVLCLIYIYREYPGPAGSRRAWLAVAAGFAIVAVILLGMMRGSLFMAGTFESGAVNGLGLGYGSGLWIYVLCLGAAFIAAVTLCGRNKASCAIALAFLFWLGGIFGFADNPWLPALLSAAAAALAVFGRVISVRALLTAIWSAGFVLLGYSSFMLLMIRASAAPPMNEGAPTDIFALSSYIARDQYGSKPLLYGATPYSRPLLEEERDSAGQPSYTRFVLEKGKPRYIPYLPWARLHMRSRLAEASDSNANNLVEDRGHGYLLADYTFRRVTTPELDMWLPRITGTPDMMDMYNDWTGAGHEDLERVEVSETLDPEGHPAGRLGPDGERHRGTSLRPTYLQNLRYMLTYQMGYMYFRYLLWNFAGRQNDLPSSGEIDRGNFITGFGPVDRAMLGNESLMPRYAHADNKGRNVYYCIPLIFGLVGIAALACGGRRGRRTLAVVALLFAMTGVAITVYLNQTPGEPRERDYAFLGSYLAFAIWIAFGMAAVAVAGLRLTRNTYLQAAAIAVPAFCVPGLMLAVNIDDHDRSGRGEAQRFADNILNSLPEGIIFTQGDNFTFPLWHAREADGRFDGHTVIDINYLSTPGYVVNLMRQGEGRIKFTATPADIAYGAYDYTRMAPDADPTPVPLDRALDELYAQRWGVPMFRHRRVYMPDGVSVLDLAPLCRGAGMPFKTLMLLDIIAANVPEQRPLHFLTHLPKSFTAVLGPNMIRSAYADTYAPGMADRYRTVGTEIVELQRVTPPLEPAYTDPVIEDQHRRQRGALLRQAREALDAGRMTEARGLVTLATWQHPYSRFRAGSYTVADTTYNEGLEYASIADRLTRAGYGKAYARDGQAVLRAMRTDALAWKRYHASLPAWRRHAVSADARRQILTLPAIDSLTTLLKQTDNPYPDQ